MLAGPSAVPSVLAHGRLMVDMRAGSTGCGEGRHGGCGPGRSRQQVDRFGHYPLRRFPWFALGCGYADRSHSTRARSDLSSRSLRKVAPALIWRARRDASSLRRRRLASIRCRHGSLQYRCGLPRPAIHATTSRHCGLSQRRCVSGSMVMHPFRLVGPGFKSDRLRAVGRTARFSSSLTQVASHRTNGKSAPVRTITDRR